MPMNPCPNCLSDRVSLEERCKQCGWAPKPIREAHRSEVRREPPVDLMVPARQQPADQFSLFDQNVTGTGRKSPTPTGDLRASNRSAAFRYFSLHSLVPIMVSYLLAALGTRLGDPLEIKWQGGQPSAAASVLFVLLFTTSHVVMPVAIYSVFTKATRRYSLGCFLPLHMGIWFGTPIIGLAALTNWLSLVGAVIHLATARRGTRTWVFVEYGSTSLALALFVINFSGQSLFPEGIFVVIVQALLLGLVGLMGRDTWIEEVPDPAKTVGEKRKATAEDHLRAARNGLIVAAIPFSFFCLFGVVSGISSRQLMPLVFFSGCGIFFGLLLASAAYVNTLRMSARSSKSLRLALSAPYEAFAKRMGGTLDMTNPMLFGLIPAHLKAVRFTDGETPVCLDHYSVNHAGDRSVPYLRLCFTLPRPSDFRCHVRPARFGARLVKMLGIEVQDVHFGWDLFDDTFQVEANDEAIARRVLHREVQERLLDYRLWLSDHNFSDHLELLVERTRLVIRVRESFREEDQLLAYYDFGRGIYDDLVVAL